MNSSTFAMYFSWLSSLEVPFILVQNSHFFFAFKSNIPGLPRTQKQFMIYKCHISTKRESTEGRTDVSKPTNQ